MQLETFDVQGFRALEDVAGIPIRRPTILTGHNDSGKTASIAALSFLLGDHKLAYEDRTYRREPDVAAHSDGGVAEKRKLLRVDQTIVAGDFSLSEGESKEFDLPAAIRLRRRATEDEVPVYEVLKLVPTELNLRDIMGLKLAELKQVAQSHELSPAGPATTLDSWRAPLLALAEKSEKVNAWVRADKHLVQRLPMLIRFSSTDEPDPEAQAKAALQASYERILEDDGHIETVRGIEEQVSLRLQEEAQKLCEHIQTRCPELTSVTVVPDVSFRHGFGGVRLRAGKGDEDVGLRLAGAGRSRRITLAVWEWTSNLLQAHEEDARAVVIVYDEPDTHLDYARQRELIDLIRTQCERPNVRMIVATHSLNLIDRVDIADVVHLRLENERTRLERLTDGAHDEVDRYLSNVSAALGLRTSVLLHERCFLAVEGNTEKAVFPVLFRLLYNQPLQSAGIALIACGGNEAALQFTSFLTKHDRNVVFLIDKDSATHPTTRKLFNKEKLRAYGITDDQVRYLGAPSELEELFSDEQWVAVATAEWPRVDGRPWRSADIAELRSDGKFSERLLDLFKLSSDVGPMRKEEMNLALVLRITEPGDVPEQIRDEFGHIVSVARGATLPK